MWLYVLAPYIAAIPAGLLARYHLDHQNENEEDKPDIGENEVFLQKQVD